MCDQFNLFIPYRERHVSHLVARFSLNAKISRRRFSRTDGKEDRPQKLKIEDSGLKAGAAMNRAPTCPSGERSASMDTAGCNPFAALTAVVALAILTNAGSVGGDGEE